MITKLTKKALDIPLDGKLWEKLYKQYQQEYIRIKLKFIKSLFILKEQQL